jgi:hypothetical protein
MSRRESIEEFKAGHGTVGLTAQVLANSQDVTMYVVVKADLTNTNNIFVGGSAVSSTNGFLLDAGEETPPIHIDDLGKVYVIGDAATQGYSWLAV